MKRNLNPLGSSSVALRYCVRPDADCHPSNTVGAASAYGEEAMGSRECRIRQLGVVGASVWLDMDYWEKYRDNVEPEEGDGLGASVIRFAISYGCGEWSAKARLRSDS
jgi:hypothetical protein